MVSLAFHAHVLDFLKLRTASADRFVKIGHVEVVRTLCEAGADKDKPDAIGRTPLFLAFESGHPDIFQILCEASADKDVAVRYGAAVLFLASQEGDLERA